MSAGFDVIIPFSARSARHHPAAAVVVTLHEVGGVMMCVVVAVLCNVVACVWVAAKRVNKK